MLSFHSTDTKPLGLENGADQTDGEPLADVVPALLTGEAPAGLRDTLAVQVTGTDTPSNGGLPTDERLHRPSRRTVRIRAGVWGVQALKILAHELLTAPMTVTDPTFGRCAMSALLVGYAQ